MPRRLFLCMIVAIAACGTNSNESIDRVPTIFNEKRHDATLDQKVQPLLNQYFMVMDHLQEQDTADLQSYGATMIQLADSLSQQKLSNDTATQSNALQGLMNIQSEMEAILMESNPNERLLGAEMLSLHWIELLAGIGYQKQTLYIFSDSEGQQWLGLNKKSKNPFKTGNSEVIEAVQVLQEMKASN